MSISLSRETIRLMMNSQKMIKKEFGVRIELDDDQMMARVFAYAAQSSSGELKKCANELMQQLIPGQADETSTEPAKKLTSAARIYRGQVITEPANTGKQHLPDKNIPPDAKKKVIYRGQRVS